jgi:polysaccharide pyruvyl transferase WcaK-like protein
MPVKVLVYGWYHQGNIGDDLFMDAFAHLFPDFEFNFSEIIMVDKLQDVDAVFFGGGSFLLDAPNIEDSAWELLASKKIFYLGIGIEADIHPIHQDLMSRAQLIAIRSPNQVERVKAINPNTRFVPDLVYSLQSQVQTTYKAKKSVLVLPNISVVPKTIDPQWKHAAWYYFKSEYSQFLDWLIENGFNLRFFSMCYGNEMNDDWATGEIISQMKHRYQYGIADRLFNIQQLTSLLSEYEVIITQRFHGIVLAEMMKTGYLAIHHHDKLKFSYPGNGKFLSYYNCSKQSLIEGFHAARQMNYSSILPIETNIFETLVQDVISLI